MEYLIEDLKASFHLKTGNKRTLLNNAPCAAVAAWPYAPVPCPLPPGLAFGCPREGHPEADGRYHPPGAGRGAWGAQLSRVGCSFVSPDPAVHVAWGGMGLSANTQGTISPSPSTVYPSCCGHGGGRSWGDLFGAILWQEGKGCTRLCSYAFRLGGFSLCSLTVDMEARLHGTSGTVGSFGVSWGRGERLAPGVGFALSGADVGYVGLLLAESPSP